MKYLLVTTSSRVVSHRLEDRPKKLLVECIAATEVPAADLVKIDTEGSEVEILQSLSVETTKAILLEYHSLDDSRRIRELLAPQFHLAYEHGEGQLGTYIFIRN